MGQEGAARHPQWLDKSRSQEYSLTPSNSPSSLSVSPLQTVSPHSQGQPVMMTDLNIQFDASVHRQFDEIDVNGDGVISRQEVCGMQIESL